VVQLAPESVVTIKIDVEGHECHVLRGLNKIVQSPNTAIITEVVESHLKRAGSSPQELFDLLQGAGYRPYAIKTERKRLVHELALAPLSSPAHVGSHNVLWLKPQSVQRERLKALLLQ
jgi:hypothetical protein